MKKVLAVLTLLLIPSPGITDSYSEVLGEERITQVVSWVTRNVVIQQSELLAREIEVVEGESGFVEATVDLVGPVHTSLTGFAAEWRLFGRFGVFGSHLVQFLAERSAEGPVVLDAEAIERYLANARELRRCGEIPCSMNCEPCNEECDRCPDDEDGEKES